MQSHQMIMSRNDHYKLKNGRDNTLHINLYIYIYTYIYIGGYQILHIINYSAQFFLSELNE